MRSRGTLALAALALAAAAAWFLWLRAVPGTTERAESAGRLVPPFEASFVTRVTIARPGERIVCERGPDGWTLTSPVRDRASGTTLDALFDALAAERPAARVPASEVRGGDAATGLGAGSTEVLLANTTGPLASVTVGDVELPGGARYARTSGRTDLALVGRGLVDVLQKPLDDFRQRGLFTLSPVEVAGFRVEQAGRAPLAFERRAGEHWWMTAPLDDAADEAAAGGLLDRVLGLRAEHFLDAREAAGDLGLGAPQARVVLQRADNGAAVALELGREANGAGDVFGRVTGRDAPFRVGLTGVRGDLARDPQAFRSKLLLDVSPFDVARFALARGGTTAAARRVPDAAGGADTWAADGAGAIDGRKAADLLNALARTEGLRIADGVSAAAAGLVPPAATLTLHGKDPKKLPDTVIEIGAATKDGVYARRSGRAAILVLAESAAARFDPKNVRP